MRNALLIIAAQGFQDHELAGTRDAILARDIPVVLASTEVGACTGKFGSSEDATVALKDVKVNDYQCVAFIGGPGAAALASDAEALRIAQETVRAGIPLGAICIAPTILAKARVLDGRNATVWESADTVALLKQYGAEYTGDTVTVDELIVTGNGPDAAEEFGATLTSLMLQL